MLFVLDAELDEANAVWAEFGHMSASQLRNHSHEHCAEYTETTGRIPISYREILDALGVNDSEAELIEREVSRMRRSENALAP